LSIGRACVVGVVVASGLVIAPPAFAEAGPAETPAAVQEAVMLPDVTPPVAWMEEAPTPSGWHRSLDDYRFPATDDESGVRFYHVFSNGVLVQADAQRFPYGSLHPDLPDGRHPIRYWAIDNAGNSSPEVTAVVSVDRTAPEIHIESPAENAQFSVGEQVALQYACADLTSGVEQCTGDVPDGGLLDTSAVGDRSVAVEATDLAGNVTSFVYEYSVVPDQRPVVTVAAPSVPPSGWFTEGVPVILSATGADGSSIRSIRWTLDGAATGTGEVSDKGEAYVLIEDEGVTTVTYQATDSLGRTSEPQKYIVRIDGTAPEIRWTADGRRDADLTIEQGDHVRVDIECTDALSGVVDCRNSAEGDDLPADELGTYTVAFSATDAAGNETRSELRYQVVAGGSDPGNGPGDPGNGPGGDPGEGPGNDPGDAGHDGGASGAGRPVSGVADPAVAGADELAATGVDIALPLATGLLLAVVGTAAVLRRRPSAR
jgi:hypothetical protein